MRKVTVSALLLLASAAAVPGVDLSDFDDDVMRAMDDAYTDLEPVLAASNVPEARTNVAILKEGYDWTREYFSAKKADAPDAPAIVTAGQKLVLEVEAALAAKNFSGAVAKARELHDNCKSCHDKYKPKKQ